MLKTQLFGHVLVIENSDEWLNHFCSALKGEGYLVTTATNLEDAQTALQQTQPDVVVLDMQLQEVGVRSEGWQLLDDIRPVPYGPQVIVVTGTVTDWGEITDLTTKRQFGGYDVFRFLPKTRFLREIFRTTVRRAMEERRELGINIPKPWKLRSYEEVNDRLVSQELEKLTHTEYDVFDRLGSGDSNQTIAIAFNVSINTVKTHVKKILAKLQLESRAKIPSFALSLGLTE